MIIPILIISLIILVTSIPYAVGQSNYPTPQQVIQASHYDFNATMAKCLNALPDFAKSHLPKDVWIAMYYDYKQYAFVDNLTGVAIAHHIKGVPNIDITNDMANLTTCANPFPESP